MRLFGMPGIHTVTGNLREIETAQVITYRPVVNNVESERSGSYLRTDPCGSGSSAATPGTCRASTWSSDDSLAPRPHTGFL